MSAGNRSGVWEVQGCLRTLPPSPDIQKQPVEAAIAVLPVFHNSVQKIGQAGYMCSCPIDSLCGRLEIINVLIPDWEHEGIGSLRWGSGSLSSMTE